jgi:hypothetical protein
MGLYSMEVYFRSAPAPCISYVITFSRYQPQTTNQGLTVVSSKYSILLGTFLNRVTLTLGSAAMTTEAARLSNPTRSARKGGRCQCIVSKVLVRYQMLRF